VDDEVTCLKRGKEHLLGWLSFGAFLVIVGAIFLITPNLIDKIAVFFRDFKLEQFGRHFYFPTPKILTQRFTSQ
jgi:hypothetical protein